MIFPFSKPGKNPDNAGNWPVVLTSHLCKWMEKVIVHRLSYYLVQKGLISAQQSGFGRSTIDALVKVSNEATPTNALLVETKELPLKTSKAVTNTWGKLKGSGKEQPAAGLM